MERKAIIWFVLIVVILFMGGYFWGSYNKLVKHDETVKMSWAQVENQYQRRSDLIPNLVNTVKGYTAHERETLERVIEARAKAAQLNLDAGQLDAVALQRFTQAQSELTQALSRLMVVLERYPDLKANENFIMLQGQLEGTENRIAVERKRFNETVNNYNVYRRRFPKNLVAFMFGFNEIPYFEADKGMEKVPEVQF